MGSFSGGSGSPLEARASAPVFLIILILLIIAGLIGLLFFLSVQYSKYKKSEKYIQKCQLRKTKRADVVELGKKQNFNSHEINLIWKICNITDFPNINYNLKTVDDVDTLFRTAYSKLKEENYFSDERLDLFYTLDYKLEMMVTLRKSISSTRQIPVSSSVSYISSSGEQFILKVLENNSESMRLELPDFLLNSKEKPETLVKSRFTYKTNEGLTYNYIARVIRFESKELEGQTINSMVISQSEQLDSQAQRHFKREFIEEACSFCSLKFGEDKHTGQLLYIFSDKFYKGKLVNISAGGCCIHTNLPVKEKQNLGVTINNYGISKLPGIIRKTRRLPGGKFALHIQFTKINLATKNKIQSFIYKFD
ncbi:MAG: PilZ domain-containing protein [Treponema sp.]|nr:PilZ domain-containing protein [Treponema sp.]